MVELIAKIIFTGSLLAISIILSRKIPVLLELPEETALRPEKFSIKWPSQIKNLPVLKSVCLEPFLEKLLLKAKVLLLKIENKIALWSEALKEKAKKKKIYENDNYWKELNREENDLENISRRKEKTK